MTVNGKNTTSLEKFPPHLISVFLRFLLSALLSRMQQAAFPVSVLRGRPHNWQNSRGVLPGRLLLYQKLPHWQPSWLGELKPAQRMRATSATPFMLLSTEPQAVLLAPDCLLTNCHLIDVLDK